MTLPMTSFKLYGRQLIASQTEGGRLRIEGVASSTIRDHHGDRITIKALRQMAVSADGMTIFMNHSYNIPGDVFGAVEKCHVSKSDEKDAKTGEPIYLLRMGIGVAETNPDAVSTWRLINEDKVKLGLSIGAMVPDGGATFDQKDKSYIIDDVDLVETSVIGIPANPRAWIDYAVKALAGKFPDKISADGRLDLLKKLAGEEGSTVLGESHEDPELETTAALELTEADLVEAITDDFDADHFRAAGMVIEEAWSSAYKDSLPDTAFACSKDRKYPHHNKGGGVDRAHLANALARQADEGNDQCGHAHLEAHAKALSMGERSDKSAAEQIELIKDGSGQHPHAHIHEHEHEHGWDANKTVHDHEHAHVHSHPHDEDHEHASDMNDWEHNHSHQGAWETEHAHDGTQHEGEINAAIGDLDIEKSTVTVWEDTEGGKVVEVNTGRAKPKGTDDQSAQGESPDTAGGQTTSGTAKGIEDEDNPLIVAALALDGSSTLLKAIYGQLRAARADNTRLEGERDAAMQIAETAIEGTRQIVDKLGELPIGRKTGFVEITDSLTDLSDVYDAEVRKLIMKGVKK